MSKSLDSRKDKRTLSEFKSDIERDTFREKIAINILMAHMKEKNPKNHIVYIDFGMDNSGKVVKKEKNVSAKPDFKVFINNKSELLEIKVHSDRYSIMTFKKSNIETYIEYESSMAVITETRCYMFNLNALKEIRKNLIAKSYKNFAAGKISYRLGRQELLHLHKKHFLKVVDWSDKAKTLVKLHNNIFNRR